MSELPSYKVKRRKYPCLLLFQLIEENQNDSCPSIVLQPKSVTHYSHLPSNRWLILPISNLIILTVHQNPQLFKPIVLPTGILLAIRILTGQCLHLLQSSLTVQPPSSIELTLSSLKSTIVNCGEHWKEDEIGDDDGGQPATEDGTKERGVSGTPNSSSPSMNTRWTISRSELYSIKAVRSVDVFEESSDQGPIYKRQMFKDKPTLKRAIWSPVICIDATHLKARTMGVLLVAVCKDRNEMIYPLAFGHIPDTTHEICAYHLAQNLKRFYKQRDDVIWLYYRATYAYRIEEFDRAMVELKEIYRKVYDELLGAGVEKFSRVHSPRKRYFLMTTNIAESMNSCLFTVVLQSLDKCSIYLTMFTNEHIKDRTETVYQCEIHPIHFNTFKVDDKWKETIVDLDKRSCSCRQWDLGELPCSHAMAVARFKGVSINALASEFYTIGFLKKAYEMGVNPVSDPEYWDIHDAIRTRTVLPWKKKNLSGRPKKLRIPSAGEKRKLQPCSKCGKKDTIK
ncbi:hypothetical protein Dsin_012950 [Dipteronia sinensis]|uniref:SWIM-type domain-containing protein n=1 Tax=Dipteronia sinensis TaxID=43782 RepID=A0AAE0EA42_9ROSI|nr:hypothetical protein Dsin_012950 [Dipteronia sinensis]